jgi:hypothetical protein
MEFDLDVQFLADLLVKQGGVCALSGEHLTLPIKSSRDNHFNTSIDRIDSSKGYTRDNVQLVTKKVNRHKLDSSDPDFVDLCKMVAANNS